MKDLVQHSLFKNIIQAKILSVVRQIMELCKICIEIQEIIQNQSLIIIIAAEQI
jgi:hypothetical protein